MPEEIQVSMQLPVESTVQHITPYIIQYSSAHKQIQIFSIGILTLIKSKYFILHKRIYEVTFCGSV